MQPKTITIPIINYELTADWYDGSTNDILFVLPGWTSNRKNYRDLVSALVSSTGMSALVLELSGHGDSPFIAGDIRPAQHFLEVIEVFDWLVLTYPEAHITVIGTSYGGFQAAHLTKYRAFERLVLRAPAVYAPVDFYALNKNAHTEWTRETYRNDSKMIAEHPLMSQPAIFKGAALVVVHSEDDQVPIATTDAYTELFEADTYIAQGFAHNMRSMSSEQIEVYQQAIIDWLSKA